MPQAPDDLRAKFPGHDSEALDVLKKAGITHDRGMIKLPPGMHPKRVWDAVDYLCFEWDYAVANYERKPVSECQ